MGEKMTSRTQKVMPQIKSMKIGDIISFPIEWVDTVRAQTSKCNAIEGGVRSTYMDKSERKIYVERKS